ncbi:hypothetical protein F5J12DRAFT_818217 [Pisolithus orientalis]|uniref:uncharacterized protein n=1 Tax=Pisolithus orientalis TaxID=936130 RepID=UPI0022249AB5|nr:uncharacterized protein F5J12DRAFT_818217 [Pisolithus orientalis]KAI6012471.1 hypothetical protein F5J12DRAFT_818217 [Pisolithus orientalis]
MSFGRAASQLERLAIAFHRPSLPKPPLHNTRNNRFPILVTSQICSRKFSTLPLAAQPEPSVRPQRRVPHQKLASVRAQIHDALDSLDESQPERHPLKEDQILRVLDTLASSARPQDLALIEKVLANFTSLCGLPVVADVHSHIIHGLLRQGNPQTLLNWLVQMRQKPGNVQPYLQHWHMFLEYCADVGHVRMIRIALSKMAHSGCPPNNRTLKILFRAMFNSGASVKDFHAAFNDIEKYTFWYDEDVANMLYDGFVKLNQTQQAREVKAEFNRHFLKRVIKESPRLVEWEESLALEVERHGMVDAVKLCRSLQEDGYKVHHRTLSILLRRSHDISDLEYAGEALDLKPSAFHWSIIIANAIRAGNLPSALSSYRQFRSTGLPLSAPLLQPLITGLCNTATSGSSDDLLDQALKLYHELATTFPPADPDALPRREDLDFMRERSVGPDAYMYGTLLRAMGSSTDVQKYSNVAISLLAAMEARAIPHTSVILASLIVIAMRCSSSVDEALEAYRRLARQTNVPRITAWGYQWILDTLSKLTFGEDRSLPPVWHYFEIVKDMRLSGLAVTPTIYAQLLKHLAHLAPDAPEVMKDRLAACVRRVHDHLTLDPTMTPNISLWNQLMDTYQRVGLFAEAYRVWEMLLVSENFDHASVSIILDACGFANAWPLAQKVHMRLSERSFLFNQGNWHSYVECMCRVGRLNDAVKTVCLQMGQGQKDVAPNADTIQVLLTFATRANQQDEVLSRIQRYLPDLWVTLPSMLGEIVIKPNHVAM